MSAAGFRTRIPSTQEQLAMYNQMTPYKLERNTLKQKGVVYIGGDKAYARYKELGAQQALAQKEIEASYSAYLAKANDVWSVHDGYP